MEVEELMKIAGMFGNSETAAVLNRFLKKFDIEVACDMEEILGNVREAGSHCDIEAVIVYADARPKEQHKRLMYNIRAIMPEILLVWLCKEQDKQFEDWAFSAVNLKNVIYINENGEIPVNRLIDALIAEHERLIKLEEEKKANKPDNTGNVNRIKERQKPKIVEKVVEKKIIVEKEVIVDRPTVVKGLLKIAAFSVSPGAGSTSITIRLAEQLSRYGRTAVIETDKSNSLDYAKTVSNCLYRVLKNEEDLNEALYELYKSGFNIVITDYGCLFDICSEGKLNQNAVKRSLLREFIKADVKMGMAFTAPWQIGKLKFFRDGNPEFEGLCGKAQQELCFLVDGETEKAERLLDGIKCFSREVDLSLLLQLLVPDIADKKQKKQRGIFGGLFSRNRSLAGQSK
jgi:hypothetical protein